MTNIKPRRILIIEDEPDIANMLSQQVSFFLEDSGLLHDVEICHRLEEGIKNLVQEHYDLVLLDFRLPDGHGKELCSRRSQLVNKDVSIIVMSGKVQEHEWESSDKICYLSKPVPTERLEFYLNLFLVKPFLSKLEQERFIPIGGGRR